MKRNVTWFSNVFWHLLYFSGPVVLVGWIYLLVWLIPIFGEMSPKNATRQNLAWWFLVRDFRQLPDDRHLPLVKCYLREFGRESGKIPDFEFSIFVQKQIIAIDTTRRERIKQELPVIKEPKKLLAIPVPMQERNVMLLAKTWFFEQMRQYELADFKGKQERLSEMVAEIKWWQTFNEDFLLAACVKPYSMTESLKQLELIFARWEAESTPEDRERIAAFRPRITAAFINDGIRDVLGGDIGKTVGNVWNIFSRSRKNDDKEADE